MRWIEALEGHCGGHITAAMEGDLLCVVTATASKTGSISLDIPMFQVMVVLLPLVITGLVGVVQIAVDGNIIIL